MKLFSDSKCFPVSHSLLHVKKIPLTGDIYQHFLCAKHCAQYLHSFRNFTAHKHFMRCQRFLQIMDEEADAEGKEAC